MTRSAISATPLRAGRPRPPSLIDRAARRMVLGRLDALHHGRVTLEDHGGHLSFGTTDTDGLRATVHVNDPRFYRDVALGGSVGTARSYIEGRWSCDRLTDLLRIVVRNREVVGHLERGVARLASLVGAVAHRRRANSTSGSRRNIHAHYDLGNDFFQLMLDETMTYSCGLFTSPQATLVEASTAKLERICRKLELGPGDHVLEIGGGWGSFAIHAASQHGCRVTTTTISRAQYDLARRRVAEAGLEDRVEVLLRDYRHLQGQYDKIVSIEMIEAVGHRYLPEYFRTCVRLLAPGGLMALQAIIMPERGYHRYLRSADFIQQIVFPGSSLPSLGSMLEAIGRSGDLQVVHLEDLTAHYVTTLRAWRDRFFEAADQVRALGYPPEFTRMWSYYLSYCEAGFAERHCCNVQLVLADPACRRDLVVEPAGAAA